MSYTKVNLRSDVQDSARRFQSSPDFEARFAGNDLGLEQSGIGYERLAPNFRVPFGHTHREQEELYVIVSGSGRVQVGDEILELGQWDAVRVAPGTWRCLEAGPDGCEVVAFGAPRLDNPAADAELEPGWWAD